MASSNNHDYLRGRGATEVFGYHAADWVQQVRATVPDGVDVLLDCAGGQTRDEAIGAVRNGGRQRLEELARLVDAGKLRPQVEAVLTLDHAREALARVASRHTRGKIVLEIEN